MDDLDELRWCAVEHHDRVLGDTFVYAVRTTGVFCRPTCPARRPNRCNVEFFARFQDAVAAGYRACRRCRPGRGSSTDETVATVVRVCRSLERSDDRSPTAELAALIGWSPRHLRRIFKRTTGVTMSSFRRAVRIDRVRRLLSDGATVTEAVFASGYGSMRAFYEHGAVQLGGSPDSFRRESRGIDVRYATTMTVVGEVLVATTDRGVCAVWAGDDPSALVDRLRREFGAAALTADHGGLEPFLRLVEHAARHEPAALRTAPPDLRRLTFQTRVWEGVARSA